LIELKNTSMRLKRYPKYQLLVGNFCLRDN